MMDKAGLKNRLLDSNRRPSATIWMLAWPAIIDQLFQTAVQYVDSAMVGSLGAVATAAIASNSSTIWLVNGMMYALGTSFAVLAARNIGSGNEDEVKKIVRHVLMSIGILGVTMAVMLLLIGRHLPYWIGVEAKVVPGAITYMRYIAISFPFTITYIFLANLIRSSGDTRSPMICNITANIANVIGNFLLIFPSRTIVLLGLEIPMWGAGLGVQGAAISTAISNLLAGSMILMVILFKQSQVKVDWKGSWKPDATLFRQVCKLASPLALERATISFGQITLTILVTSVGTTALAAHHLAITAESITFMPVSGFSIAAMTLVAQSLGASRKEQAVSFARKCLLFGVLLMSFTGMLMFIFAKPLMSFFTGDSAVIDLGARVLRIEAFAEPFFALAIVGSGVLRGAGDTRWPFIYSSIGMWVVRLLPAAILINVFGFGLEAAWSCMVADLFVRGLLIFRRFLKGKWIDSWKH